LQSYPQKIASVYIIVTVSSSIVKHFVFISAKLKA